MIARLLQHGVREYSWQRAFDCYADLQPELRDEILGLRDLRPYYEYSRAQRGARLPKRSVDREEMRRYVVSIRQLAG